MIAARAVTHASTRSLTASARRHVARPAPPAALALASHGAATIRLKYARSIRMDIPDAVRQLRSRSRGSSPFVHCHSHACLDHWRPVTGVR